MRNLGLLLIGIAAGSVLGRIYPGHANEATIAFLVCLAVVLLMLRSAKRSEAKLNQEVAHRLRQIIDERNGSDPHPDDPWEH